MGEKLLALLMGFLGMMAVILIAFMVKTAFFDRWEEWHDSGTVGIEVDGVEHQVHFDDRCLEHVDVIYWRTVYWADGQIIFMDPHRHSLPAPKKVRYC